MQDTNKAVVEIYDSRFYNNTALEGGVFSSESESYFKCTRWDITNNIAIKNAVLKWNENGYFLFIESHIYNNYANVKPFGEIFSSQIDSTIANCSIHDNYVQLREEIRATIMQQGNFII